MDSIKVYSKHVNTSPSSHLLVSIKTYETKDTYMVSRIFSWFIHRPRGTHERLIFLLIYFSVPLCSFEGKGKREKIEK